MTKTFEHEDFGEKDRDQRETEYICNFLLVYIFTLMSDLGLQSSPVDFHCTSLILTQPSKNVNPRHCQEVAQMYLAPWNGPKIFWIGYCAHSSIDLLHLNKSTNLFRRYHSSCSHKNLSPVHMLVCVWEVHRSGLQLRWNLHLQPRHAQVPASCVF